MNKPISAPSGISPISAPVIPVSVVVVVSLIVVAGVVVAMVVVVVEVVVVVGLVVVVVGHGLHGPPQSMLSSPWFCIPSVQVGQGSQGPPQSTSSSHSPSSWQFFIPS